MLLLENARIPPSVYSTVVTQLVSSVSVSQNVDDKKIYVISKATLHNMLSKDNQAMDTSQTTADSGAFSRNADAIKDIQELCVTAIKANERHENEDRASFRVTLDDAVEALADIKV